METYNSGHLDVGDGHKIWYSESGDPKGIPGVSMHGGPGAKSKPKHLYTFDEIDYQGKEFRVIQIDQRGCGLSLPQGSIERNTTQDLIEDVEKIRKHLKIEKWFVAGGSWGSAMGVLYTQAHPRRVHGLLLRSVYLANSQDEDWLFGPNGARRIFPDITSRQSVFFEKRGIDIFDRVKVHEFMLECLNGDDKDLMRQVVVNLSMYESNIMKPGKVFEFRQMEDVTEEDINSERVFCHYQCNSYFIEDDQIIKDAVKLEGIPVSIIHGRYDIVCAVNSAFRLHKAIPHSTLRITDYDGHHLSADSNHLMRYMFVDLVARGLK